MHNLTYCLYVRHRAKQLLPFFVHPTIPHSIITKPIIIIGDGWCGFRVIAHWVKNNQDAYIDVKKDMLACFMENKQIYQKHFKGLIRSNEQIEQILSYGIGNAEDAACFCPTVYWFRSPECVQIAADTYRRPIAVYPDNDRKKPGSEEYAYAPLLYVPFKGPTQEKSSPIIMQHSNGNHWVTVDIKRRLKMEWPCISSSEIKAYKSMGNSGNLRKTIRRHLQIVKEMMKNQEVMLKRNFYLNQLWSLMKICSSWMFL